MYGLPSLHLLLTQLISCLLPDQGYISLHCLTNATPLNEKAYLKKVSSLAFVQVSPITILSITIVKSIKFISLVILARAENVTVLTLK